MSGNDEISSYGSNVTIDVEGSELTTIIGGAFYDDGDASKITLAAGIAIGDASERTTAIQITGTWTAAYYGGSGRVVFKVGSTYSAIILDKSAATTYNVNGDTYAISGGKFVKQ